MAKRNERNGFMEALQVARKGLLVEELAEALNKVAEATINTGEKGKVVLTLEVKRQSSNQVAITAKYASTVPLPVPEASFFFLTDDRRLSRRDMIQPELPGTFDEDEE